MRGFSCEVRRMKGFTVKRQVIIAGVIVGLLGAAMLAACSSGPVQDAPGPQSESDTFAVALPTFPEKATEDNPEAWLKVLDENPIDQAYLDSLPAFSYKTAAAVFAKSEADAEGESMNGTYSPISLYYALALATQGAAGKTAEEMNTMLGAPDAAAVPKESGNLFRVLSSDPYSTIDLANSIWMSKDEGFEPSFIDVATQQFYATPFAVEFGTSDTDKAIAAWISDNTNGTIDPQVQTDGSQIMSIINTVYFKGSWSDQFDAANTKQKTFKSMTGDVQADFMTQRLDSPSEYVKTDTFTRAGLSFTGGAIMSFVLPAEGVSARDMLTDEKALKEAFTSDAHDSGYITYTIPKTKFDSSYELIDPLMSLGMKTPFSDQADFSNLTATPAFISKIKQESYITWDENGAEASAYTDIGMNKMSAAPDGLAEIDFTLDRPFLFQITSSQGVPLFVGICENPAV